MQVMGWVTSVAWGGRYGLIDRLGVEVASTLNVSVGGIVFYATLTTCFPAWEKGIKLKIYPIVNINTTCSSSPRIFHSPPCKYSSPHHLSLDQRIAPECFTVQCLIEMYLIFLFYSFLACFSIFELKKKGSRVKGKAFYWDDCIEHLKGKR